MSEEFNIEIVNPEKSFLSKKDVTEVVIPAFEGEMGILKDHISIISFLKPGIITIQSKSSEEKFFVEDGIRWSFDPARRELHRAKHRVSCCPGIPSCFISKTSASADKDDQYKSTN